MDLVRQTLKNSSNYFCFGLWIKNLDGRSSLLCALNGNDMRRKLGSPRKRIRNFSQTRWSFHVVLFFIQKICFFCMTITLKKQAKLQNWNCHEREGKRFRITQIFNIYTYFTCVELLLFRKKRGSIRSGIAWEWIFVKWAWLFWRSQRRSVYKS